MLHRGLAIRQCAEVARRKKGDRVTIYMGMVPELPIAMLACARLGAPHTVVFGGFSAEALVDRIKDSQAVAGDHAGWRLPARQGGEAEAAVDEALHALPVR